MKIPFTNWVVSFGGDVEKNMATARPVSFNSLFTRTSRDGLADYKINVQSLYAVFRMNSDIRNCVRELQNNVGKSGVDYLDLANPEKEPSLKKINDIELLFNSPESTHKSFRTLLRRTVRDMEIAGNAYWVILKNDAGKPVGFQPIDPRTMTIVADKSGVVHKYIQKVWGQDAVSYDPDEILHFKGDDDPNHEVFGMGNLEPIIWEARTDGSAMMANFKFFENNAVPSALYILDERIPTNKLKEKFEEIKKSFGGASNYKKAGAIVGVKDIKMMNVTQKDMEFLAGRVFTTEKICAAFGVPKFMLGYTEKVNNNNGVEIEKNFMGKSIIPREQTIESTINSQFMAKFGDGLAFFFKAHRFSSAKELEERAEKMYKAGMITLRQVKKMIGEEITDTDEEQENLDKYIIHSGASAVLLEDVGIDPVIDENEE